MKMYETEVINKASSTAQIPAQLIGAAGFYTIKPKQKILLKHTDERHYLSPYERIVITGEEFKDMRCTVTKRRKFNDPFADSIRRMELENSAGLAFLEVVFVQPGETFNLVKGIPVVTETQAGTWIEKYRSLRIAEPFLRQEPSRDRAGSINIIKVQNMQYEMRSPEEIDEMKARRKAEKNEIKL